MTETARLSDFIARVAHTVDLEDLVDLYEEMYWYDKEACRHALLEMAREHPRLESRLAGTVLLSERYVGGDPETQILFTNRLLLENQTKVHLVLLAPVILAADRWQLAHARNLLPLYRESSLAHEKRYQMVRSELASSDRYFVTLMGGQP